MNLARWSLCAAALAAAAIPLRADAQGPGTDFGAWIEHQLRAHAPELFGIEKPLAESATGPFTGADSTQAIEVAPGLHVSLVSSATAANADQIALWPDDEHPTHLFTCNESNTGAPALQRVDLSKPANANVTTILSGLSSCDPVRRTPWGTIVVAEEAGAGGGLYEVFDPAGINTTITVTNRATGATTDPRVVKRQAVGALSFEGILLLPDGTMYYGDELGPSGGNPGGAIYKFAPATPYAGGPIAIPSASPLAAGQIYGLQIDAHGDVGQGAEIGVGQWLPIDPLAPGLTDGSGNVNLRAARLALHLTGYYRPEDMDRDPIAERDGVVRGCWTNTGRMSNGGGSAVESGAIYGEVMCLTDSPDGSAASGAMPQVERFVAGDRQANFFDNISFQRPTGNLVILEDGEVEVVKPNGTTELRGNDVWLCLPDGADRDVQTDGCVRIASLRDTSSEPTGFIFTASGTTAYVNLQHRSTGTGALLRITGFRVDGDRHQRRGDDEGHR